MQKGIAIMASSAGSGKDTVADCLVKLLEEKGFGAYSLALGEPIHEYCEEIMGNRSKVTRDHLQKFGESVRGIFGESAWIDYTDRRIDFLNSLGDKYVPIISDVRKLSEFAHYFIEHDFVPIYVMTDIEVAKKRLLARDGMFNPDDLNKTIETQLNFIESLPVIEHKTPGLKRVVMKKGGKFNDIYIVNNSGSLEELKKQLEILVMEVVDDGKLLS